MELIDEASPNPVLKAQDMHGPVEVSITVHVMTPAKVGNELVSARATFSHPAGEIPSTQDISQVLEAVSKGEGLPAGTRLMSKAEFVAHVTKRETGSPIPMQDCGEFVAVQHG